MEEDSFSIHREISVFFSNGLAFLAGGERAVDDVPRSSSNPALTHLHVTGLSSKACLPFYRESARKKLLHAVEEAGGQVVGVFLPDALFDQHLGAQIDHVEIYFVRLTPRCSNRSC